MNINIAIIGGNITHDLKVLYAPNGSAMLNFAVAINRTWKSKDGEPRKETTFIGVTAFGRAAENIANYLQKGSPILVEGRLRLETWEKDGVKQSRIKIILERFNFCGDKKKVDPIPASGPGPERDQEDKPPVVNPPNEGYVPQPDDYVPQADQDYLP